MICLLLRVVQAEAESRTRIMNATVQNAINCFVRSPSPPPALSPHLAVGCCTSTSRRIALPSFVMTMPPIGSRIIFSIAFGPSLGAQTLARPVKERHGTPLVARNHYISLHTPDAETSVLRSSSGANYLESHLPFISISNGVRLYIKITCWNLILAKRTQI